MTKPPTKRAPKPKAPAVVKAKTGPKPSVFGRQRTLFLDDATVERAKEIGGSASEGIRIAVAAYKGDGQ